MSSGTSDEIKGRAKEAIGALTDNKNLKKEGRRDQTVGKMKNVVDRVVDKVKR